MAEPDAHPNRMEKTVVRVIIQTSKHIFFGEIHTTQKLRLSEVLNRDEERFLPVTNATMIGGKKEIPFLLIQRDEIVWIAPVIDGEATLEYRPGSDSEG